MNRTQIFSKRVKGDINENNSDYNEEEKYLTKKKNSEIENEKIDHIENSFEEGKHYCNEEQITDQCPTLKDDVCGWFNENINCLVFPCANDYINPCLACSDTNVEYYTFGKCPKPDDPCINLGCSQGSIYVGSKNSDKYYVCDCHYADRIKPENVVCFESDEEALNQGRTKSEC